MELFEEAGAKWDLERLYQDLAAAKKTVAPHKQPELTDVEKELLRGLLLGYSPVEIADQRCTVPNSVTVALSQGHYRYVEVLTGRDCKALESWRDVAEWLQAAGYQCAPPVAINWAHMPDVPVLHGRKVELDQLKGWMLNDSPCRLIEINGIQGIGKTALAVSLARASEPHFNSFIWQSLRHKPKLENVLSFWLEHLPEDYAQALAQGSEWYDQLRIVMTYLREHRCLVILENFDMTLKSGSLFGEYEPGYETYRELLKRFSEEAHQSCVIVTSRESNPEIQGSALGNDAVRRLTLKGLDYTDAEPILAQAKLAAKPYWKTLVQIYRGNPAMLKLAAMTIGEVFDEDVGAFLKKGTTIVGDIRYLLERQYDRLSSAEQVILYELAKEAKPVALSNIEHPQSIDAIKALLGRSLIEKSTAGFALSPVMVEFMRWKFNLDL